MMRNRETSEFKGSAFVTFKTQEDMDKFMAEAETKFNDVVLEKQTKQNYYDSKSGKEKSKLLKLQTIFIYLFRTREGASTRRQRRCKQSYQIQRCY